MAGDRESNFKKMDHKEARIKNANLMKSAQLGKKIRASLNCRDDNRSRNRV